MRMGSRLLCSPMKNKFECIGAIETTRSIERPLEADFIDLLKLLQGFCNFSGYSKKLIEQVKRVVNSDTVSTSELLNLRAQLTTIIGDLGDQSSRLC